jgi:intein/homing endonuclease
MIPKLENIIADISKELKLSRYKIAKNQEAIGRRTLQRYINIFDIENQKQKKDHITDKINILKQAAFSDIVWDKIIKIEYLDDPKEFVYDFTVPGNDSFMVDTGVLVHNTLNT